MYFTCRIGVAPKEGRNLPDVVTVSSDMFDALADLNQDAACDFTVVTMSVSQQLEGEDEFRSVPGEDRP
jgi:hypothetical protein